MHLAKSKTSRKPIQLLCACRGGLVPNPVSQGDLEDFDVCNISQGSIGMVKLVSDGNSLELCNMQTSAIVLLYI